MARPGYSRAHYERVCPKPDAPGAAAERILDRPIRERAMSEREELYPVLTVENAQEAIDWQEARIRELRAALERSAP